MAVGLHTREQLFVGPRNGRFPRIVGFPKQGDTVGMLRDMPVQGVFRDIQGAAVKPAH